tara:strand:+ start:28 stop:408 length:381 start_codon:yes stop_codon:yes gene_type:complete
MAVQSSNNSGTSWFDIRGPQRDGRVDSSVRKMIMDQAKRCIALIAPADVINMAIGLSSTPGMEMDDSTGDVLLKLQEDNTKALERNTHLGNVCSELQAEGKEGRKRYKTLEAEFRDYKQANPPITP